MVMEKSIEKLINQLLLNKHGLSCNVVNCAETLNYNLYVVIINVKYSDMYPTLGGNLSILEFLNDTKSKFINEIYSVLKYVGAIPFDMHTSIYYNIADIKNFFKLEKTFNDSLDEVNELFESPCLKKIVLKKPNSFKDENWLGDNEKNLISSLYGDDIYVKPFPTSEFHLIKNCDVTNSYINALFSHIPGLPYTYTTPIRN
jgi:hypothetical protein